MSASASLLRVVSVLTVLALTAGSVAAQGGPPWAGRGGGWGRGAGAANRGGGPGRGPAWARQGGGPDSQFTADRDVFHALLQNHEQIRREVKNTSTGVETLTESDKPEVVALIQEHVAAMAKRVEERRPIHMRDPLFAEVFRHADKIQLKYEKTDKGVRVAETSEDPHVVQLIQAHGGVVSLFVKNGFEEARKNHDVPGSTAGAATVAVADGGSAPAAAGCPCAACPRAAAGQCPRAAASCPAGKDCPNAKSCPAAGTGPQSTTNQDPPLP